VFGVLVLVFLCSIFRALLDAWEESLAGVFYEFSPGMVS
jgi:hypothetical protein